MLLQNPPFVVRRYYASHKTTNCQLQELEMTIDHSDSDYFPLFSWRQLEMLYLTRSFLTPLCWNHCATKDKESSSFVIRRLIANLCQPPVLVGPSCSLSFKKQDALPCSLFYSDSALPHSPRRGNSRYHTGPGPGVQKR